MTNAELIARLREDVFYGDERLHNLSRHNPLHMEAADRIEALSISNATLIAERDEALEWLSASQGYIADAVYALDKQEALEAKLKTSEEIGRAFEEDAGQLREKLAKLVDAAEKVINSYWHSTDGVITGIYDLEAALARVKGEIK